VRICKVAGFNSYSECTDLLTGIHVVTKVTYGRRALTSQSSSTLNSGTPAVICTISVCGVMTGALLLHQSSLGTH
jgi:hypothetical protein